MKKFKFNHNYPPKYKHNQYLKSSASMKAKLKGYVHRSYNIMLSRRGDANIEAMINILLAVVVAEIATGI